MKRLAEKDASLDESELRLADLFASAEAYGSDPFRKRRVLVKLLGQHGTRPPRILRGALIAAALGATATAAALGGGILPSWFGGDAVDPGQFVAPPAPNLAPISAPAADVATPPAALDPPPPAAAADPVAAERVTSPRSNVKLPERARVKSSEDPTQVLDAVKALRADHDPAKAQSLLNDYMKKNPNGVLSEDALALSIEAAATRRDPRAREYATRYLAQFPNGKYRALATRALQR